MTLFSLFNVFSFSIFTIYLISFIPSSSSSSSTPSTIHCTLRDNPSIQKTIPLSHINDDYCDCLDGSDEPHTSACPSTTFLCKNVGYKSRYIPSAWINDGFCDCCDGSDENNNSSLNCPNTCKDLQRQALTLANQRADIIRKGLKIRSQYEHDAKHKIKQDDQNLIKLKLQIDTLSKTLNDARQRLSKLEQVKKLHDEYVEEKKKKEEQQQQVSEEKEENNDQTEHSDENEQKHEDESRNEELSAGYHTEQADNDGETNDHGDESSENQREESQPEEEEEEEEKEVGEGEDDYDEHDEENEHVTDTDGFREDEAHDREHEHEQSEDNFAEDEGVEEDNYDYDREEEDDYDDNHDHYDDDHDDTSSSTSTPTKVNDLDLSEFEIDAICADLKLQDMSTSSTFSDTTTTNKLKAKVIHKLQYFRSRTLNTIRRVFKRKKQIFSNMDIKIIEDIDIESCVRQARDASYKLEERQREIERQMKSIEEKKGVYYGGNEALRVMHGRCIKSKVMQYEFEHCPFDMVRQYEFGSVIASLGKFDGWANENKSIMKYSNGDKCWNGPVRSVQVELQCGNEDVVVTVDEPNRCTYSMKFKTPAVCEQTMVDDIMNEVKQDEDSETIKQEL